MKARRRRVERTPEKSTCHTRPFARLSPRSQLTPHSKKILGGTSPKNHLSSASSARTGPLSEATQKNIAVFGDTYTPHILSGYSLTPLGIGVFFFLSSFFLLFTLGARVHSRLRGGSSVCFSVASPTRFVVGGIEGAAWGVVVVSALRDTSHSSLMALYVR